MTKNNVLVSGLMVEHFILKMMVPQRPNELTRTSDGLLVSFTVSIKGKQENTKDRGLVILGRS